MFSLSTLCVACLALGTQPSTVQEPADGPGAPSEEQLLLGGLDGKVRERSSRGFSTADPRKDGIWSVRTLHGAGLGDEADPDAAGRSERLGEILLADGDTLRAQVMGGEGETLGLELGGGVRLMLGIEDLASVRFPQAIPEGLHEPLQPAAEGDRLYRRSGTSLDRVDGTVDSFTMEGIRFESDQVGMRVYGWREVAALFIEVLSDPDDPAESTDDRGVPIVVDLAGGGRLRGRLQRLEEAGCRMSVAGTQDVFFEWTRIREVLVDDGRLTFLSELAPVQEVGRGAAFGDELGMVWPHRMDRSVNGGPLVVGGRTWRRGIGMHAPTRVTWKLDGEARVLRGRMGIDDSVLLNAAQARGAAIFRVIVDGKTAFESDVIRGGHSPVAMPEVDLKGATELTLEVDPAGDFRGDRADWLRVVLVRS